MALEDMGLVVQVIIYVNNIYKTIGMLHKQIDAVKSQLYHI